jgi:hypothetical protein
MLAAVVGLIQYDHTVPPAPELTDLVRSLAETGGRGPDTDQLATRDSATDWLRAAGLLADDAGLSNSEHGALVRLRNALREVLAARAAGRENVEAAARLTRALADGRLVVTVTPAGVPALASSARAPYSSVVAAIAMAVAAS